MKRPHEETTEFSSDPQPKPTESKLPPPGATIHSDEPALLESRIDHKDCYGLSQEQLYVELVTQPAHRVVAWSARNLLAIAANYQSNPA